jgi:hypothetical protein
VWSNGSQAFLVGLNRFGAILISSPAAAPLPVFSVDIQQLFDPWFLVANERAAAHPSEHLGKGGAHHCSTTMAETTDLLQPPVMSRRLQPFEGVDV